MTVKMKCVSLRNLPRDVYPEKRTGLLNINGNKISTPIVLYEILIRKMLLVVLNKFGFYH